MKKEVKEELQELTARMEEIGRENDLDMVCFIGEKGLDTAQKHLYSMVQGRGENLILGIQILIGSLANALPDDAREAFRLVWRQFGKSAFDDACELAETLGETLDDQKDDIN